MSDKSVFCIATSRDQADQIVDRLKSSGFFTNDISAMFADTHTSRDFAHEKHTKAPEGALAGAGTGGALGGALGWMLGMGSLGVLGMGPFVAAGPIMAALSGAAIGATVGSIAGGLIGLGIPEIEAKRYEGKLKSGNILLSVHTENADQVALAKDIFAALGAQDVCTTREAPPPLARSAKTALACCAPDRPLTSADADTREINTRHPPHERFVSSDF